MMYKKHKIINFTLAILMAATGLSAGLSSLLPKQAYAAASYTYVIDGDNCLPYVPSAQCVATISIVDESSGAATLLPTGTFSYKDGSKYDFTGTGGTIHVDYKNPGQGTLTDPNGKKQTVNLSPTGNFTGYFVNGATPESSKTAKINVKVAVNFGDTDPSLSTDTVAVTLKAPVSVAAQSQDATPDQKNLTNKVINYTTSFSPEGAGSYSVCGKADFIKASGNQVCKTVNKKAGTALSVNLTADGDTSKLTAPMNVAANQNACVSSNSLGWFLCKIYDGVGDASTWLFQNVIAPWLHEPPISLDPTTSSYQTWSTFRVYGDIFLVIALLVIVFGESIGGGMIDAYTAKKVLPRLLIAAVLINLSLYIVAALVDIANVLGAGIGELITKGLGNGGAFHINLSGAQAGTITGVSASTGIGVILFALLVKGGASILASGIAYVALLIISMVFFGLLAMFITLVLRQAGILILVLISPIAFALYCLPNTEQYFKKWWELLLELLMMYPIVVMMFSAADLLSVAVDTNYNGNNTNDLLIRPVISFVLQFLPLFFIPFAFRIASKTIGRLNEAVHGVAMRGHEKVGKGLAQQYKQNTADKSAALRERAYTSLKGSASKGGFIRRKGMGILAGQVGGYNLDARISAIQAQRAKEINDTIATGKDSEIRGLTVNKAWADKYGKEGEDWQINKDTGKRQYKSLGGAWVDAADVDRGQARWGHDKFAQQAALSYEMRKANTDDDRQRIAGTYETVARGDGGWGMDTDQADGAWIGAAFENQNSNLQFKYVKRDGEGKTTFDQTTGKYQRGEKFDHKGFVQEVYEKRGSYAMSNMDATTIRRLREAAEQGSAPQDQLEAIAATMQDRMAAARTAAGALQPTGADGSPEPTGAALGAGHVYQEMDKFVKAVGRRGGSNQGGESGTPPNFTG